MEIKALVLGLAFSLWVFALKNGLGLHYYMSARPLGFWARFLVPGSYSLLYGVLFFLSWWVLQEINLLQHLAAWRQVLHSGMFLHVLLAALFLVWGLLLLRNNHSEGRKSLGWLFLVLPCPVCMLVVFLNTSFLLALFPESGLQVILLVWAAFVGTGLGTALLLSAFLPRMKISAESMLGGSMLALAFFFLLSVIFMPQFSELEEVYSLALYTSQEMLGHNIQEAAVLIFFSLVVIGSGFWWEARKSKRM